MCVHSIFPAADNIRSVSIPTVLQQWSQLWVGVISVKPVCSVILRTWWSENKRPGEDCPLLAVQCNEIMEKQIYKETTYILKCRQELSISVVLQCCVHFKPADNICFSEAHCTHRISSSLQNSVLSTGTMQRVPTQNNNKKKPQCHVLTKCTETWYIMPWCMNSLLQGSWSSKLKGEKTYTQGRTRIKERRREHREEEGIDLGDLNFLQL